MRGIEVSSNSKTKCPESHYNKGVIFIYIYRFSFNCHALNIGIVLLITQCLSRRLFITMFPVFELNRKQKL